MMNIIIMDDDDDDHDNDNGDWDHSGNVQNGVWGTPRGISGNPKRLWGTTRPELQYVFLLEQVRTSSGKPGWGTNPNRIIPTRQVSEVM